MGDTIVIETPVATVLEVTGLQGPQGPTGPQGPAGDVSGSVAWSNVTGKPATFTPSAHTHTASEVTDFNSAVVAAAPPTTNASLLTSGTLADARLSAAVTTSLGKADTASQPGHTHAVADVTGLQAALDGKQASGSYAAASHTHTPSEVGLGNVSNTAQVTSVSGTAPIVSSGGTTPAISIQNSPTLTGDVTINGASTGVTGSLKVGNTTGSFNRDVEINGNGIVLRNIGGSGTTTIALGQGSTSSYTLTPPAASGTLMLNNIGSTSGLPLVTTTAGAITTLALGSAGQVLKVNSGGTAVEFGAAGGVTSGSVDNAVLRADGVGGSASQSSDINIEDATTSTANNVTISNQHGGQTNSSLVLSPKGTGSLSASKPNGAATGGNARGANATDWQTLRTAATQVASGTGSVIIGGDRNTSSSVCTIAGGELCTASGTYSIALGRTNAATTGAANAVVGGQDNTASGRESFIAAGNRNTASAGCCAILSGDDTTLDRPYMVGHSGGRFAAGGDSQSIHVNLRAKTTTNSAVELKVGGYAVTSQTITIPAGKVISGIVNIHGVKSDGSAVAHYIRQFSYKRVGATSTLVGTATIGTDIAAGTSIAFNDPDTNGDAISISVTGVASETWRWTAHISAVETAYGT